MNTGRKYFNTNSPNVILYIKASNAHVLTPAKNTWHPKNAGRKAEGKMRKNISVIGGDLRQLTLYKELAGEFECAALYGFEKLTECSDDISALQKADVVVLPMPVTTDGVNVNAVYTDEPLSLDFIAKNISPSAIVFGGQIKPELAAVLSKRGIMYFDYFKREELAVKNAVPTALAI